MEFSSLILAGSRPDADCFALDEGAQHKSLLMLDGKTLLARVIEALQEAGSSKIIVACDSKPVCDLAESLGALTIVSSSLGPSASVGTALEELGTPLLVTTADHAFLKPEWVKDLIAETPEHVDLSLMLARKELIETALPVSQRTYLRFADGEWSGCNLFFFQTPNSSRVIPVWRNIEVDRKRPWRLVARLGLGTIVDYAIGRLGLAVGIERLGRRMGVTALLVPAKDGLAAVDIDDAGDLADARDFLDAGND